MLEMSLLHMHSLHFCKMFTFTRWSSFSYIERTWNVVSPVWGGAKELWRRSDLAQISSIFFSVSTQHLILFFFIQQQCCMSTFIYDCMNSYFLLEL
jgi:hypothetical protein